MNPTPLSEALRLLRSYHDVSQIDLAASLQISRSYLSELENGRKQPSLDLLKAYASHFDLPLSALILFSETVESGVIAERVRKTSTAAALKLLNWMEARRGRKTAA